MSYRATGSTLALLGVLGVAACSAGGDDLLPGRGNTSPGADAGSTDPAATGAACDTSALPAPVRRLSRSEYFATMRDLFPGVDFGELTIPQDATQMGFENRTALLNPSAPLIEQYSASAAQVAASLVGKLDSVLPCTPTGDGSACATTFVQTFGKKVFRRPLTDDETTSYTDFLKSQIAGSDFNGAVQLTIEAFLQAPPFLHRLEFGEPDPAAAGSTRLTAYEVAARLSYLLWGSMPDAPLLDKARDGALYAPADREAEARRMLADPRARGMMVEFHRQWLDFDKLADEPKDAQTYPTYTPDLEAAIREESDRFVADVFWKGDGTLRSFFTSAKTEVNAPLAALYGVPAPASGWAEVSLNANERAGFLTRANFLAGRAHKIAGSPPLRAVFIFQRFLCQTPSAAPADANLAEPTPAPGAPQQTNRQRFEDRLAPPTCSGCHSAWDGLGFALENYDAIGQFRTQDNGLPVDATGTFSNGTTDWHISGGIDLSNKLADSPQVDTCATQTWLEYAIGRAKRDSDTCRIQQLNDALTAAHGDVREMLVALVKTPDFTLLAPATP